MYVLKDYPPEILLYILSLQALQLEEKRRKWSRNLATNKV